MIDINSEAAPPDNPPEREVLFRLDGHEHTIPKTLPAKMAVMYSRMTLVHGADAAIAWLMDMCLGDAVNARLLALPEHVLSSQDYARLVAACQAKLTLPKA